MGLKWEELMGISSFLFELSRDEVFNLTLKSHWDCE